MTDREQLELAAKAAGYQYSWSEQYDCLEVWTEGDATKRFWQPHRDDGDALRLAVATDQIVTINRVDSFVSVQCGYHGEITVIEHFYACMFEATRLAIVRAAAQIQLNKEAANE